MRDSIIISFMLVAGLSLPCFAEAPSVPATPDMILGQGILGAREMADFLVSSNPDVDLAFAKNLAELYIREALVEDVNHDIAFSQMCLETGFLRFDKVVTMGMNNFGGIGSVDADNRGVRFPSILTGVRAQIQHLKAYASSAPLKHALTDPRYYHVRFGSAPSIHGLAGTWSNDAAYGQKIKDLVDGIYVVAFGGAGKDGGEGSRVALSF
ncbi:MAG: glucosaminidase domain-containing protein [Spirochaetaceae bacterium]|jgi:hypothetical protein|nr:glucosaminidase domain-containing protein [Spirochaetaceae bacterium]